MKKLLLLLFTILINLKTFSQAPSILWQKTFGGTSVDEAACIQQTADGGYIVAADAISNDGDVTGNHGNGDFWVLKLSVSGTIQWQKALGGTDTDYPNSIQQTSDGGYIIAGTTISNNGDVTGTHLSGPPAYDAWVVKLSNTGVIQWQKTLGGTESDYANSIQQTTDGGYIVAGYTASNDGDVSGNHGGEDYWIIKLSNTGIIQWQKTFGGTSPYSEEANSIKQTNDGGYIVAGFSGETDGDVTGNHGNGDFWIVKLSNTGVIQWQKSLGGTEYEEAKSIQQTTDGGYIVAGYTTSNDGNVTGNHGITGADAWVVKLSNTGIVQWQKTFGGTDNDYSTSIQLTSDGGYIIAGFTYSYNGDVTGYHGQKDAWIVKISSTGTLQWQKTLGGSEYEEARSIQQTSDGNYIIAGYTDSNNGDVTGNHDMGDVWIIKLSGTLDTQEFGKNRLMIFPNPTSSIINLQTLNQSSIEKVKITDILGKTILEKQNTTSINIEDLSKGVYMIEAFSENKVYKNKFVKN